VAFTFWPGLLELIADPIVGTFQEGSLSTPAFFNANANANPIDAALYQLLN
jgi:hypothetical protein